MALVPIRVEIVGAIILQYKANYPTKCQCKNDSNGNNQYGFRCSKISFCVSDEELFHQQPGRFRVRIIIVAEGVVEKESLLAVDPDEYNL
jgi:hypothetical protein